MKHRTRWWWWVVGTALVFGLAACGGDNERATPTPAPAETATPQLNLNVGPGLALGGADSGDSGEPRLVGRLPGCSDGDDEECPAPINLPLDAEASAGGITVRYLSRYFDAATAEENSAGVPVRISPGERFAFDEQAVFDVYLADSIDAALSEIEPTDSGAWTSAQGWHGTIAVQKDDTQEPPVNTSIGAFELPDGRVIVLKAVTTGKYGWDLWSVIYEQMLDSLAVEPPAPPAG